jgi:archaellum component FlaC
MGIEYWASVAQISSVVGGVLFALWKIWRKIDQHQANSSARSDVIEVRLERIESQFGPNGGGLREAVNRISNSLQNMDAKLDNVSNDLSQLKGEFKEHVRNNE